MTRPAEHALITLPQPEAQRIINSIYKGTQCLSYASAEQAHARESLIDALNVLGAAITAARAYLAAPEVEPPYFVAWKHTCNALCVDDLELWVDRCPHCGKPAPTPEAKQPVNQQLLSALKDSWNPALRSAEREAKARATIKAAEQAPQPAELTDEEVINLWQSDSGIDKVIAFARAVLAAQGAKT